MAERCDRCGGALIMRIDKDGIDHYFHSSPKHKFCEEIARLRSELAQKDAELTQLRGIAETCHCVRFYPAESCAPITRDDVKLREASRRRTLDIAMRETKEGDGR